MSPMRGLDSRMADLMREHHHVTGGMPSMFESILGGRSMFSDHSGFPGMPRGRRMSRSSSFDSDMDTVRPGSAYSGFPGMPRSPTRGFQTDSSRFPERSEPFNMRRTDSHSSSSGSRRRRSPSPPVTSYSRGYRTTERVPQSAWAAGANRSPSPQGYGTSRSYATRAASPPRRHRSPSPPPRRQRQRSPSPVSRSYGRSRRRSPSSAPRHRASSRADSARGFRTTERRPEGASSRKTGSSSRDRSGSRSGQSSRSQYNPGYSTSGSYSHGTQYSTSQGTSNNAYNARSEPSRHSRSQSSSRPQQHQQQRARSPPPQPRGHARNTSRPRAASNASASTARPAPARTDLKKIFDAYNTTWESLSRHDKSYPLPASSRDLHRLDFAGGSSSNKGNWSAEQIFVANVQVIFLAGFGISCAIVRRMDGLRVDIENAERQGAEIESLAKWLRRKEQPRWHPDRMNARTGRVGVLDEGISKKRDVVAMRTAGQELLSLIGK